MKWDEMCECVCMFGVKAVDLNAVGSLLPRRPVELKEMCARRTRWRTKNEEGDTEATLDTEWEKEK